VPTLAVEIMSLGWLVGVGVGLVGIVIGQALLRTLVRLRVPWWPSVAAPLLLFGPAIGMIVGTWLHAGELSAVSLGGADAWDTAKVGWSLLVFLAANTAFDLVRAFLSSHVVQDELGIRIPSLLFDLARLVLWVVLVFAIIAQIWHAEKAVAAALGLGAALSLAVALALQETLKNFIAGLAIVTEGMYKLGDWVFIGEDEGEVVAISRRTTKIKTRVGDIVTFPNNLVTTNKVRNESRPTPVHAELVYVSAAYDAPPNRVRDVLRRALLEVPAVLTTPEPRFRLVKFEDSGIQYQVKFWLTDIAGLSDIRSDVMIQIWYHFHRDGIEIPYPVRELRRRTERAETAEARGRAVLSRLRSVPFFQALPEDLIGVLARDAVFVDFGAGERVVQQHEPADACYVVDAGRLAVLVSDGAHEKQVAVLEAGALFGEMGLLTGEPRSATVRALGDARLVVVGPSALRAALERSPDLASRLAEAVMLRKEGLLEARAGLDALARARVDAGAKRLREVIKRFFRLPEVPPAGEPPAAGPHEPPGRVAGTEP